VALQAPSRNALLMRVTDDARSSRQLPLHESLASLSSVPKQLEQNYAAELASQRDAWERKPALRSVYRSWYERIQSELAPNGPTVEIGGGSGNFKQFMPETVSTDIIAAGPWLDALIDARRLPFADASVGNIVMADVLHHLQRPFDFLRDARRALRPGGRLVLLEPAATPWARLVLGLFHHEPVDLSQDLFAEDGTPEPLNDDLMFANQAFATLLFVKHPQQTMQRLPGFKLRSVEHSDFVVYPATGGFSYYCLVPKAAAEPLQRLEGKLVGRTGKLTGMRVLIVLERDDEEPEAAPTPASVPPRTG
jgi:SAM-dependent methyltransferase